MMETAAFESFVTENWVFYDRVTVWLKYRLTNNCLSKMRRISKAKIKKRDLLMKYHPQYQQRLYLLQPTREQLRILLPYIDDLYSLVNYVELAYDRNTRNRIAACGLHVDADCSSVKSHQRRAKKRVSGKRGAPKTMKVPTTFYTDKQGARCNWVGYPDKPSKIDGQNCAHSELRYSGSAAVKAIGIMKFSDLLTFDAVAVLRRRVTWYKPKADIVRRIGRDMLRRQRKKAPSRWMLRTGLYMKSNPATRLANLVLRGHQAYEDRYDVSGIKQFGRGIKIDLLRHFEKVDPCVAFPDAKVR
jgi:hypothetical protein